MPELIFEHKQIDNGYIIEMRIIRIKKDESYPEGIKYSFVAINRETKERVLGFDNHERKGHHFHRLGKEEKYVFKDEWKLIGDFMNEYENIKKEKK